MKKFTAIIDNILLVIIVLSVAQIIVDEIGVIAGWGHLFELNMIYIGFAFDSIFTIEFIVRSIVALKNRGFVNYFFIQRGWIDFLASLPLLLLVSGPAFYGAVTADVTDTGQRSFASLMKVFRAIRVTRILRILRLLKIFGKIENVFSKMTQHHVATISTLIVLVTVGTYMTLSLTGVVHFTDRIIEAKVFLALAAILVLNVIFVMVYYAGHFASTVSDPIYVMKRGLSEEDYNFTAKIKPQFKDDEVYELVDIYNKTWLPIKVRIGNLRKKKEQKASAAGDDYTDLL